MINLDGSGQQRITFYPDFDAFPMFTSDGKRLVWASNRNGKVPPKRTFSSRTGRSKRHNVSWYTNRCLVCF